MIDMRRWAWLGVALLVAVLLYCLHNILSPFLVGILLAYLADPLVDRLERLGLSRTWGVVVVFSLFALLFLALLLVQVPGAGSSRPRAVPPGKGMRSAPTSPWSEHPVWNRPAAAEAKRVEELD